MFNPGQIATTVDWAVGALEGVLPLIGGSIPNAAQFMPQVETAVADLKQAVDAFKNADGTSTATDLTTRVENDVNAVFNVVGDLPLPPPAGEILGIIKMLLPALEAAIKMVYPTPAPAPTPAPTPAA